MISRPMIVALLALVYPRSSMAFAPLQEASCVAAGSCQNDEAVLETEAFDASAVIVVESFFDGETCQHYRETPLSSATIGGNGVGELIVESDHVKQMISTFKAIRTTQTEGQETAVIARHTYIDSTTVRHQDRYAEGSQQGQLVTSNNAFVFLNTNSEATFIHGDSEGVPVVEGTLVVFDGAVPHNTLVTGGVVHLLGPLNTETMLRVGNSTDPVIDCEDGFLLFETCFEFGILNLFLMVTGVIGSLVLCTVGVTPNDS